MHRADELPRLLVVEAVASALALLLAAGYFPRGPPTPPSPSAARRVASAAGAGAFVREVPAALRQLPFVAMILSLASAFGVCIGLGHIVALYSHSSDVYHTR